MFRRFYILPIFILLFVSAAFAETFTVRSAIDTPTTQIGSCDEDCTLREAIFAANSNGFGGMDTINFNIPGGGVKTINLVEKLPSVRSSVIINGASQPGYFGKPMIRVHGNGLPNSDGIVIGPPYYGEDITVTIIGLSLTDHTYAIYSECVSVHKCDINLYGNFIGVDQTGNTAIPNASGIRISPAANSTINIGGTGVFEGNLISASDGGYSRGAGIEIKYGPSSLFATNATVNIVGNKIGTNFDGTAALGNSTNGIIVSERNWNGTDVADVTVNIGGTTPQQRNIISGNREAGIKIECKYANIRGNYIGLNAAGTAGIPNGVGLYNVFFSGIEIHPEPGGVYQIGDSAAGAGNVISTNNGNGIFYLPVYPNGAAEISVRGNYIGTNADGNADLGNVKSGIHFGYSNNFSTNAVVGGITSGDRNVISGNNDGIYIAGGDVSVFGNYIGTDKTGTMDLGNGKGIFVYSKAKIGGTVVQNGTSYDAGNLISGNSVGIDIKDSAEVPVIIQRNKIGTNAGGTGGLGNIVGIEIGNNGTLIGSETNAADGNIISGNFQTGILLNGATGAAQNTKIYRNFIGTNSAGGSGVPNGNGIEIRNSPNNQIGLANNGVATNIISGNQRGIYINGVNSTGNKIENNVIGLGINGNDLGNVGSGVEIFNASQNFIGSSAENGNTIANNGKGVWVRSGTDNEIRRNAIFSNDELGIDLDTAGVTPNDAGDGDTGANRRQNFPFISNAATNIISGSLNSAPNGNYTIDFYRVDSCDSSGYGEGRYYLGSTVVLTDALGDGNFNFPVSLSSGQFVTATATVTNIIGADDTSEFSRCRAVAAAPTVSFSVAGYTVNEGAGTRTIVVNRAGATADPASVNYATSNGTAIAGEDYTATSGTLNFGIGETVKTFNIAVIDDTIDETDETVNLTLSNATGAALESPSTAVLTIIDNDLPPTISISDVTQNEGNSGTTAFTFQINLSSPGVNPITVNYATADGTANLSDYIGLNGLLTFAPGETVKNLTVSVNGDLTQEPDETFFVNLSNPTNATISDNQGIGTILNDDVYYSIGGTIRKSDNSPLVGATLQLSGTQTAQTTTDSNGRYVFPNLSPNGSFIVSPSEINYTFAPVNRQYSNLTDFVSDADFEAIYAPLRQVRVIGGIFIPGQNAQIAVEMISQGNENRVSFSLDYDSLLVFNPQVVLGSGAQGATLTVDNSMSDKIGVSVQLPSGQTFPNGIHQIVLITFNTAQTNLAGASIRFDDSPTVREIITIQGGELPAEFIDGMIGFVNGFEADVAPRPYGNQNGSVTVADFTQIGRFVAGLDTIPVLNAANEFQRADIAPRSSLGNGALTVSDFTQAGRYAAGLDPIQYAGGAVAASLFELDENGKLTDKSLKLFNQSNEFSENLVPTNVRVVNTQSSPGQQVTVSIEADTTGTENGFGFSLNYDANKLSNPIVQTGADTQNAALITNTNTAGRIGVVLAMPFGQAIQAGTRQIITVTFDVAANAPGGLTPLTFGDTPTFREVSDVNANVLQSNFTDGEIEILAPTAAEATVGGRVLNLNGGGLSKIRVTLTASNGQTRTTITSSFGYYKFENVPIGETYILSVVGKGYVFNPPTRIINVMDNIEHIEFIGESQ